MTGYGRRCHSDGETRDALLLQVAALESKMVQMRALLLEQEKKRLRLCSKINSLSPIDQLPAEIKIEIFYETLRLQNNHTAAQGKNQLVTPFFLGKICQGWRDFVWSSPILWTNLHLCLSKDKYEAQTNLLHEWLSRTANYPLSFCLTTADQPEVWISEPPIEILTMFASVSARWKEVDFFLPNAQNCFDAISAAENSLPLLTTATARLVSTQRQLNIFSTAPELSELHLYEPLLDRVQAPWHQLRVFSSESCTVDEICVFLHKVPQVIRCSLMNIDSIILDETLDEDIFDRLPVLEHLEYLELSFKSVDLEATRILGPVKLPSLRELSLRGPFGSSPYAILPPIMTAFHSSHLLENFTFGGTITSDHDLIQALENIPSVKELRLDFDDWQDPHKELLTKELLQRLYPPHTDILLPNLRKFTYTGPTSLNEDIHLFRDVLVYRFRQCALQPTELGSGQGTVSQIQSVTVTSSSRVVISPGVQEELDNLVQEGLELLLTSIFAPDSESSCPE